MTKKMKKIKNTILSLTVCMILVAVGVVSASAADVQTHSVRLEPHMTEVSSPNYPGNECGFNAFIEESSEHRVYVTMAYVLSSGKTVKHYDHLLDPGASSGFQHVEYSSASRLFYVRLNPILLYKNCTASASLYVC